VIIFFYCTLSVFVYLNYNIFQGGFLKMSQKSPLHCHLRTPNFPVLFLKYLEVKTSHIYLYSAFYNTQPIHIPRCHLTDTLGSILTMLQSNFTVIT